METTLLPVQAPNQANIYEDTFNRQKAYFATNITRSHEWRLDQLNCLAQLLSEHTNEFYDALNRDFSTALSEKVFEVAATLGTIEVTKSLFKSWMQPIEAVSRRNVIRREPLKFWRSSMNTEPALDPAFLWVACMCPYPNHCALLRRTPRQDAYLYIKDG